jgi:hypothetical protein
MVVSLPEHRIYTVLACFQAVFVMMGTFAIRVVTGPDPGFFYKPAPALALWLRNSGYLLLLVPAGCLVWALMDMRHDPEGHRAWKRVLVGVLVTLAIGAFFWGMWEQSTIRNHGAHFDM